jgi:transcriptional regulator with GAF, ATPase, and Fis domain
MDARAFAELARDLTANPDEAVTFEEVVKRAMEVVPGCRHAGITLRGRRGRLDSVATSDDLVAVCDGLQYELEEGPCLDAVSEDLCRVSDDLAVDERWPRWGPRVAELGVGSVIAVQLTDTTKVLGALNLYGEGPRAFSTDDVDLAFIYAIHATTAMRTARLVTGLENALQSRHGIGLAQGILMEKLGLTPDRAFEALRRVSNHRNVPLRQLAQQVVEHGAIPSDDG